MVLIVRRDEVADCVRSDPTFAGALSVLETAFRAFGLPGQIHTTPGERTEIHYSPDRAAEKNLWIMPMYVPPIGCAAMRIGAGDDSIIAVYDFEYMGIQGTLQDAPLEPLRAGLPLALAAKHLAPPGARTLGCIGGGPALAIAVAATAAILPIEDVVQYTLDPAAGAADAALPVRTRRASTPEEVARGADILFVSDEGGATLDARWLKAGQLVAATDGRSIPPEIMAEASLVHASRQHAGVDDQGGPPELGEVLRGDRPGWRGDADVVLFVSQPNIGVCDAATGWWCYQVARERGLGVNVSLAPLPATESTSL